LIKGFFKYATAKLVFLNSYINLLLRSRIRNSVHKIARNSAELNGIPRNSAEINSGKFRESKVTSAMIIFVMFSDDITIETIETVQKSICKIDTLNFFSFEMSKKF
jgi:hypothetical protein